MLYVLYPDVDLWNYMLDGVNVKDVSLNHLNIFCSVFNRLVRSFVSKTCLFSPFFFNGKLKNVLNLLNSNDSLLVCDYISIPLLSAISFYTPQKVKKFLWLWNKVDSMERIRNKKEYFEKIKSFGFEIRTFDPDDAKKYGFVYMNQFYRMVCKKTASEEIEYDFYFIGFKKNRGHLIEYVKQNLEAYRNYFKIVESPNEMISYRSNVELAKKSKCLVEILNGNQIGLTLRPLEALSLGKKLITNNRLISKYDFYNPNNIFIIDERPWDEIALFLNTPTIPVAENLKKEYSAENWLMNFK